MTIFSEKVPDNIDELETMNFVDYENGPRHGIVIMDNINVIQAVRASAEEGWVDVYVALGWDEKGWPTMARIRNEDGTRGGAAVYRVYGEVIILQIDPTGKYIKKEVK
jgi:hypothetical protein